jgi:hypothetical protein
MRTTDLVEDRGWTLVETYADNDTSASKVRGPKTAWGQMIADAAAAVRQIDDYIRPRLAGLDAPSAEARLSRFEVSGAR